MFRFVVIVPLLLCRGESITCLVTNPADIDIQTNQSGVVSDTLSLMLCVLCMDAISTCSQWAANAVAQTPAVGLRLFEPEVNLLE